MGRQTQFSCIFFCRHKNKLHARSCVPMNLTMCCIRENYTMLLPLLECLDVCLSCADGEMTHVVAGICVQVVLV